MSQCKELFARIDRREREFISLWESVCNIESPTDCKAGLDRVGACFAEVARANGMAVSVLPQTVAGDLVSVTLNPDAKAAPVTLCAHIDTVHPVGAFGTPPVRIEGDTVYGPGVTDCKGGAVAALYAMCALHDVGFAARPVTLFLQTDEETHSETSGRTTIRHICEGARNSVAHLNIESSRAGEPSAVLWRKGISTHSLTLQGKAAHASRCAFGISAVEAAARIVTALSGYKDHDGITFNCGLIAGGTAPNTVPDTCRLTVEYRFFTAEQRATAAKILREAIAQAEAMGVSVTDEVTARDAMEKCERNFALLDKMNEIYAAEGLPTLSAKCSVGGSDAADATVAGIPCVDSIGVEGDRIHTLLEYARVSSLREAAYRIGAVIYCI